MSWTNEQEREADRIIQSVLGDQDVDNSYRMLQVKQLAEQAVRSSEKQETFFQHILLVASGTLGIVVSLHTSASDVLYIRLVFALAVVLLSLGTLCTAITVYDYAQLAERCRQAYTREALQASREERKVQPVSIRKLKRTLICEKASCVLLVLSIVALASYSVLSVL